MFTPRRSTACSSRRLMNCQHMFEKNHPDLPEYIVNEALANTHEFARSGEVVRDRQDDEGSEGHGGFDLEGQRVDG